MSLHKCLIYKQKVNLFQWYIGNLDERVSDRVLYDILIQVGRVVDLYIPRDKETERPKGYAFAEYETEEIAEYAVKLFSGLVTLYNRTLKFAVRCWNVLLSTYYIPGVIALWWMLQCLLQEIVT